MDDIVARIDKFLYACARAGWEDVLPPEELLLACKAEILSASRQWIPVYEELPEEGQEVLVWNNGGQCEKPWQGHVLCAYRNGEWRESQEFDLYPGVTHWMPLPEPPNGEK